MDRALRLILCVACFASFAWPGAASADGDPHAEMAAALAAQADLQPPRLVLPVTAARRHAATASAVQRGPGSRAASDVARTAASAADAANRVSQHAQAQAASQTLAHQAQAAAAAAAGQTQSEAAKERATHPHSR
jgi:hypothetical protein